MQKYHIETSQNPEIVIDEITGDLILKGHSDFEVLVKTSAPTETELVRNGDQVTLSCPTSCTVYLPHHATVRIENIGGNANIKSLDGQIFIGNIGGELGLRDVGKANASNIGLDLSAKRIRGDLEVVNVGRTAIIRDIDGQFKAENIGAHLNLRDVSGSVVATVGGNAEVILSPVSWQTYEIKSGGNISCRLAEESSAVVQIKSGSQKIRLSLPEISRLVQESEYTATLGEGGPQVNLEAGASVELRSRATGWESLGSYDTDFELDLEQLDTLAEQIEEQVSSQLDLLTDQLDIVLEQVEENYGKDLSPEKRARVEAKILRAQQRAEQAGERARQKIERKMQAKQREMERAAQRRQYASGRPTPPAPPSPARRFVWPISSDEAEEVTESVSEDERLLILKMLEEKKISAAEAEQLLSALEGRST